MGSPEKPLDVEMGDMGQAETDKLAPDVDIKSGEKEESKEEDRFTGLKKEELLEVSSQRKWVIARWVLFIVFWAGWVGMLVGAIIIVVKAPRCKPEPTPPWYQDTIVYQADLKKFSDGSITEMKNHVDYVKSLNARTMTVSNINNPDDLEKIVGDASKDFSELVSHSHNDEKDKDLKIVIDLRIDVLSTGSMQFMESASKNCTGVNCDLFAWKDNTSVPATDDGGTWVYHSGKEENYRATNSDDSLAYLNYKSSAVTEYISSVVKKWVGYGADGFQLGDMANVGGASELVKAVQTTLDETQAEFEEKDRKVIGLFLTSSDIEKQFELFPEGNDTNSAAVVINTGLSTLDFDSEVVGTRIQDIITEWRNKTKPFIGATAMNTMNLDLLASRHSPAQAAGLTLLSYALPGVPVVRSGDEALLSDDVIAWNTTVEKVEEQVPNNASTENIKVLSNMGNKIVNQYRALQSLRWDDEYSVLEFLKTDSTEIVAFTRKWDIKATILTVCNPTAKEITVKITFDTKKAVKQVIVTTGSALPENDKISFDALVMEPGRTMVVEVVDA